MLNLQEINVEYKFSAVFGVLALFVSLFFGLIAGNALGHVLFKSVILTIVFIALGFILVYAIRRFVPEVYSILNSSSASEVETEITEEANIEPEPKFSPDGAEKSEITKESKKVDKKYDDLNDAFNGVGKDKSAGSASTAKDSFVPLGDGHFENLSSTDVDVDKGKLGKHVFEEKKMKYEPKIVAEAIRTMMSRDKE